MNQASRGSGPSPSGRLHPCEGAHGRRLDTRREVDAWVAQRRWVLTAPYEREGLGRHQLSIDESEAA